MRSVHYESEAVYESGPCGHPLLEAGTSRSGVPAAPRDADRPVTLAPRVDVEAGRVPAAPATGLGCLVSEHAASARRLLGFREWGRV
jgi:hypothetical protein